jgi:hypothetical protein
MLDTATLHLKIPEKTPINDAPVINVPIDRTSLSTSIRSVDLIGNGTPGERLQNVMMDQIKSSFEYRADWCQVWKGYFFKERWFHLERPELKTWRPWIGLIMAQT